LTEKRLKWVGVYCGSRDGARPVYRQAALDLGAALARHSMGIVYGGAQQGLMGAVADGVLAGGQQAIGVLPKGLARAEFAHPQLTELHYVESMHERKALMEKLSDAFVALPGGFGTLDELFEILTWAQIGLHSKPIGLLNVDGYWDPLEAQIRRGFDEGFIPPTLLTALVVERSPSALLERLVAHQPPPPAVKWMGPVKV
jgi:uncharacterized protein (TIGR00730 family)